MAATTTTLDFTASQTTRPGCDPCQFMVAEIFIDNTSNPFGSATAAKAMYIPAKTLILAATVICETAEGSTFTLSIGDSAGDTTWFTTSNFNSTSTSSNNVTPKYYASADYISLVSSAAGSKAQGVLKLVMVGMDDRRQYVRSKLVTG